MTLDWHNDTFADRLARRTSRRGRDECWPWTGHLRKGYGAILAGGRGSKMLGAHVAAWAHENGRLPAKGMVVDHICGLKACVNPSHLREVSFQQNGQHRPALNANNSTGTRNVYWDKRRQAWRVQAKIGGRDVHGGYFADRSTADAAARALRASLGFLDGCWAKGGAQAATIPRKIRMVSAETRQQPVES